MSPAVTQSGSIGVKLVRLSNQSRPQGIGPGTTIVGDGEEGD